MSGAPQPTCDARNATIATIADEMVALGNAGVRFAMATSESIAIGSMVTYGADGRVRQASASEVASGGVVGVVCSAPDASGRISIAVTRP